MNRLMAAEVERVLKVARLYPDLSRGFGGKITDEGDFSISEATFTGS